MRKTFVGKSALKALYLSSGLSARDLIFEVLKCKPIAESGSISFWPRMHLLTVKEVLNTTVREVGLGHWACLGSLISGYTLLDSIRHLLPSFVEGPLSNGLMNSRQLVIAVEAADEILAPFYLDTIRELIDKTPVYSILPRFNVTKTSTFDNRYLPKEQITNLSNVTLNGFSFSGLVVPQETEQIIQWVVAPLDKAVVGHIYAKLTTDGELEILSWELAKAFRGNCFGLKLLKQLCLAIERSAVTAISKVTFNTRPIQFPYGDLTRLPSEVILAAWDALETVQSYLTSNATELVGIQGNALPLSFADNLPVGSDKSFYMPKLLTQKNRTLQIQKHTANESNI